MQPGSRTDGMATALCGAGFWEWSAAGTYSPPTFSDFERFIRENPALEPLARQPHARRIFEDMVRLEFEARGALSPSGPPEAR